MVMLCVMYKLKGLPEMVVPLTNSTVLIQVGLFELLTLEKVGGVL